MRAEYSTCADTTLASHRQLLEHDANIAVVATWIAGVERERKPAARTLTKAEIKALVRQRKDIVAVLANADPADKRATYDERRANLTYHPDGRVQAGAGGRVLRVRVGGAIRPITPRRIGGEYLVAAA
jgi:hypothetical protein